MVDVCDIILFVGLLVLPTALVGVLVYSGQPLESGVMAVALLVLLVFMVLILIKHFIAKRNKSKEDSLEKEVGLEIPPDVV